MVSKLRMSLIAMVCFTLIAAGAGAEVRYAAGPVPAGTEIAGTITFEHGPERLLDGDDSTFMQPMGGTAKGQWSLYVRFKEPLQTLGGVRLGRSDPHGNYFPKVIELHVDTTGDGTYDLHVATLEKLGAGERTAGEYLFDRKPAVAHGLELRVISQNVTAAQRAFMLSRLDLLYTAASWGDAAGSIAAARAAAPEVFAKVDVTFRSNRPFPAITVGDEDKAMLRLNSKGDAAVRLRPGARMTAFDGHQQRWLGEPVEIAAGGTVEVPFDPAFERRGWWDVAFSVATEDDAAELARGTVTIVYFDPVGMRREPAGDDMLVGFTESLSSDATAEAAALIGVDWSRDGIGWPGIEPQPGQFRWEQMDTLVERGERFGIMIQAGLGYSAPWAIKPKYLEKLENTNWPAATYPPREDAWRSYVRAVAERYKGRVLLWETWNEADLHGFFRGTTDEYLMLQKAAYEEFKAVDERFGVMTSGFATLHPHGGQNHNPDMQLRTIRDNQKYFDIHTHHEHGAFPGFAQIIDGPLARLREHLVEDRPLYFNETSIGHGRGVHFQAETLVKKITFAKARGAAAYNWFHMHRPSHRHDADNFGTLIGAALQPRPHYVAFNEVVRHLRGKPSLGQLDLGMGRWGFAFGDAREQVLVLWRESNDASDFMVELPLREGGAVERWDMMGNRLPAPTSGAYAVVLVTFRPEFVVVRGATDVAVVPVPALDPTASRPDGAADEIHVSLSSLATGHGPALTLQPRVAGEAAGPAIHVRPGAREALSPIRLTAGMNPLASHVEQLTLEVKQDGEAIALLEVPVRRTHRIPAADASVRPPDFTLTSIDQVVSFVAHDPANEYRVWTGPEDLSARVWLQLVAGELKLIVDVRDDRIHQPYSGNEIFSGDSIQFVLQHRKHVGFFEIGAAPGPDGKVIVHTWVVPVGAEDPSERIDARIASAGGSLRYELTIPLEALGMSDEQLRAGVRFNLMVNDNDGAGRDGFIRLAPGLGVGKEPGLWPTIRFE